MDQALCFGWIDGIKKRIDDERYRQYFSKRKPKSTWSRINKEKVARLTADGLMTEAGLKTVEIAKANGMWHLLDDVDALITPEDLQVEFDKRAGAEEYYLSLSKSIRKGMLYWIISAKRPETRLKRILEIAECAAARQKPKQFQ